MLSEEYPFHKAEVVYIGALCLVLFNLEYYLVHCLQEKKNLLKVCYIFLCMTLESIEIHHRNL